MSGKMKWLLLVYRVPTEPARKRTYVWRKLRALGAVYLQQAVALLPLRRTLEQEVNDLSRRIQEFEGEVTLLKTASASAEWEQDVVERFRRQAAEEYAEVVEGAARLQEELAREGERGKFSFAELEENERGLESLRRWLAQARERDFFAAPAYAAAEKSVAEAAARLEWFAGQVYERAEAEGKPGG